MIMIVRQMTNARNCILAKLNMGVSIIMDV